MIKNLEEVIARIPKTPGVYFFKNKAGEIIYIGKASRLKKRVQSYFQKTHNDYKTPLLVENIYKIDWIELSSEVEALFMEAELIKRHKPLYNVRERDDKNFIFIRISLQDDFPTVSMVRNPSDDRARYFGPFVQAQGVRQALRYLRKIFPFFVGVDRRYTSKLEYQIGILPRPDIAKAEYRKHIRQLMLVLEGKSTKLIDSLEKQITQLAKNHNYEEATLLRDRYLALKSLNSRVVFGGQEQIDLSLDVALSELADILELKTIPRRIECYDISNFAGKDSASSMIVFTNGVSDRKEYRHFKIRTKGPNDFAMMQETLHRRFSSRNNNWSKPDLIIIDGGKGQLSSAKKTLMSLGIDIRVVGLAKRYETIVVLQDDISTQHKLRSEGGYYLFNFEPNSALLHLLQRIRDEAHRFAVSYHTTIRAKRVKKSILDDIPGVGPVTRKKLIRAFGGVSGIRLASQSDISDIVGVAKARVIKQRLG